MCGIKTIHEIRWTRYIRVLYLRNNSQILYIFIYEYGKYFKKTKNKYIYEKSYLKKYSNTLMKNNFVVQVRKKTITP